jgi:hypothetical protein
MLITVGGIAVFFLGMGVYALAWPERVLTIFGTQVTTRDGRNEVRAVYGGYGITMAAALAVALGDDGLRAGVFVCLALAMLGMALGRVCSAVIDGRASAVTTLFGSIELAIAVALWLYRDAA